MGNKEMTLHESKLLDTILAEVKEGRDEAGSLRDKVDEEFKQADKRGRDRAQRVHDRIDKVEETQQTIMERVIHLEDTVLANGNGNSRRGFRMPSLSKEQKWGVVALIVVKLLVGINLAQAGVFDF